MDSICTRQSDAGERALILLMSMTVEQLLLLLLLEPLVLLLLMRRLRRRREGRRHARRVGLWFTSGDEDGGRIPSRKVGQDLSQKRTCVRPLGGLGSGDVTLCRPQFRFSLNYLPFTISRF